MRGLSCDTHTVTATDRQRGIDDVGGEGVGDGEQPVWAISDLTVSRGSTLTRTVSVTDGDSGDARGIGEFERHGGDGIGGQEIDRSRGVAGTASITMATTIAGQRSAEFDVTVPNSRPVVSPVPDKRISRESGGSVTVTVTDADPGDAHTVSARSSDEAVATVDVTGTTLTLESVSSGEATITVTARDDSGESNATSAAVPFDATVNSPPEVDSIADLTVTPGGDGDADGDGGGRGRRGRAHGDGELGRYRGG